MTHHPLRDQYKVLGIPREAGQQEIKQAYRRIAKQIHPDRNGSERAAEQFHAVHAAYSTLIDPVLRERHDQQLACSRPVSLRKTATSQARTAHRRREIEEESSTGQPAPAWAYFGLHLTGLLFGLLLIGGTCWMIVFRDHSWVLLLFTAPGWFLVPDCLEGMRVNSKAGHLTRP
jgi:hypothetical protein